jgi:hypothetical protein
MLLASGCALLSVFGFFGFLIYRRQIKLARRFWLLLLKFGLLLKFFVHSLTIGG